MSACSQQECLSAADNTRVHPGKAYADSINLEGVWFNCWADVAYVTQLYAKDRRACVAQIVQTMNIPCKNGFQSLCEDMVKYCPPSILADVLEALPTTGWKHETLKQILERRRAYLVQD